MDFKKTIKYDGKIKGLHIVDGELVNLDGEIIDIISILERVYGENHLTSLQLLKLKKA